MPSHFTAPFPEVEPRLLGRTFSVSDMNVEVTSIDIAAHGCFLAVGCSNGMVLLYDLSNPAQQRDGLLVGQIRAKGIHTNLLLTVKFSDDCRFVFAGVHRGSSEMLAIDLGRWLVDWSGSTAPASLLAALPGTEELFEQHQHEREQRQLASAVTYSHSDAKLRGFAAVVRLAARGADHTAGAPAGGKSEGDEEEQTTPPTVVYRLACGKDATIKSIHVWDFCVSPLDTSSTSSASHALGDSPGTTSSNGSSDAVVMVGRWRYLYDVSTKGTGITHIEFRHQGMEMLAKCTGVGVRVWNLNPNTDSAAGSADAGSGAVTPVTPAAGSTATPRDALQDDEDHPGIATVTTVTAATAVVAAPIKPTYFDVSNSLDCKCLIPTGNCVFCGSYEFAVVNTAAPKEANRDSLELPEKFSYIDGGGGGGSGGGGGGGYYGRRITRIIENVICSDEGAHALVLCSDGGVLYFHHAQPEQEPERTVEILDGAVDQEDSSEAAAGPSKDTKLQLSLRIPSPTSDCVSASGDKGNLHTIAAGEGKGVVEVEGQIDGRDDASCDNGSRSSDGDSDSDASSSRGRMHGLELLELEQLRRDTTRESPGTWLLRRVGQDGHVVLVRAIKATKAATGATGATGGSASAAQESDDDEDADTTFIEIRLLSELTGGEVAPAPARASECSWHPTGHYYADVRYQQQQRALEVERMRELQQQAQQQQQQQEGKPGPRRKESHKRKASASSAPATAAGAGTGDDAETDSRSGSARAKKRGVKQVDLSSAAASAPSSVSVKKARRQSSGDFCTPAVAAAGKQSQQYLDKTSPHDDDATRLATATGGASAGPKPLPRTTPRTGPRTTALPPTNTSTVGRGSAANTPRLQQAGPKNKDKQTAVALAMSTSQPRKRGRRGAGRDEEDEGEGEGESAAATSSFAQLRALRDDDSEEAEGEEGEEEGEGERDRKGEDGDILVRGQGQRTLRPLTVGPPPRVKRIVHEALRTDKDGALLQQQYQQQQRQQQQQRDVLPLKWGVDPAAQAFQRSVELVVAQWLVDAQRSAAVATQKDLGDGLRVLSGSSVSSGSAPPSLGLELGLGVFDGGAGAAGVRLGACALQSLGLALREQERLRAQFVDETVYNLKLQCMRLHASALASATAGAGAALPTANAVAAPEDVVGPLAARFKAEAARMVARQEMELAGSCAADGIRSLLPPKPSARLLPQHQPQFGMPLPLPQPPRVQMIFRHVQVFQQARDLQQQLHSMLHCALATAYATSHSTSSMVVPEGKLDEGALGERNSVGIFDSRATAVLEV